MKNPSRQAFATSAVAKNMIEAFFFNLQEVNGLRGRDKDAETWTANKVAVLGAGMMGAGIAYAQASRGVATVLKDVTQDKADKGKAYSVKLTQPRVEKGRMSPHDQKALLDRITATDKAADLQGCDLIIEAVFEQRDLKAKVTQEAEPMLADPASEKQQQPAYATNETRSRRPEMLVAVGICTHLGCTPNWLDGEQKFKCPCHGSGFYITGINFEGPAPRPLERVGISLSSDGMLEVDKSLKFQEEMGQWADPNSFVEV